MSSIFLTAYDPSDLPGGSVDPLGFERGYLHLAEKILPGMTNAAVCPRYFSLLCAGVGLAGDLTGLPEQKQRAARQESVRRLERIWAVANFLASQENGKDAANGLRGSSYVSSHVAALKARGATRTNCDFLMLTRQTTYGALGLYGGVAARTKLIFESTMELVPGMGDELALAFRRETEMPTSVRNVVAEPKLEVGFAELANWGRRAHLWGKTGERERAVLRSALSVDAVRDRFVRLLHRYPVREGETELMRLRRIGGEMRAAKDQLDLWEALEAILGYEACYRCVQLALERILYLARNRAEGYVSLDTLVGDEVIRRVADELPGLHEKLHRHLNDCHTEHMTKEVRASLDDVLPFLALASDAAQRGARSLVEAVMTRHAEVQRGKYDRGRRKMPWLENREGRISLTLTRVGGPQREALTVDEIGAHPYRLTAADNWLRAAGGIR